jgi:insertion element IS1 protein InsB
MNCPKCHSNKIGKNCHRGEKQNYQCKECGRQFVEFYSKVGYSKKIKEDCLTMYVNGNGFRAIERITNVNHNTVIRWAKETGKKILKLPKNYNKPLVAQLDKLQTFIGKKNKRWVWTALDKNYSEVLEYVIGDRSSETFEKL